MTDEYRMEYCFTWKIENYSLCFRNFDERLKSPFFIASNFHESKWCLQIHPFKSVEKEKNEYMSAYLKRNKKDLCDEIITISFIIEIIDGNGKTIAKRGDKISKDEFPRGKRLGWKTFTPLENVTREILTWREDILTIRCCMFSTTNRLESEAITEIGIDKCSFLWEVNFPNCVESSPTKKFSVSETLYEISVIAPNDEIEIQVVRVDEDLSLPRILRGNIVLLNQKGVKVLSQSAKNLFDGTDGHNIWNFPSFITKTQIENNKQNCAFSLLCEFLAANGKESSNISQYTRCSSNILNNMALQDDLSNLLTSKNHYDVELRSGDTTLSAHKSLLSARSPVFSAMFDQDMIEKQSGVVDISDVDPETLKTFLEFVYSGTVDMKDYEEASKLLIVADKYQVLCLKDTCAMFLTSQLSLGDACHILGLADMFNLKQLKKNALDYFAKNMKEVSILPQWEEFALKNAKLSMEIISYLANNFEVEPKKK